MVTKELGKIDFLKRWQEIRDEDGIDDTDILILPQELHISGLDLATRVDHSAFFMLKWNGRKLMEAGTAVWPHVDYPVIAADVRAINEKFPQHKIAFDETGNVSVGVLFGQDLEAVMEPIHITNPIKLDCIRVVRFLSQLGILELEPNSPVIREIEEQQKVISDAGFERYEHPSGVHDDLFWGLALACYAAVEYIIGLPPAGIETAIDDVETGVDADTIIEGIMQQVKYQFP